MSESSSQSIEQPLPDSNSDSSFVADSLAVGVVVMLVMTVVQRGLGFFRGIWFCRVLDDAVVGQWSIAYDFVTLITPVMLLGLPGSLPRYVEHYRKNGHLTDFVRRIAIASGCLGLACFLAMAMFPEWFGWLIFLDPQNTQLVYAVSAAVIATIVFNFVWQMVSSLRQSRLSSGMYFLQSVAFTVFALLWLVLDGGLVGIVFSYVVATLLATIPGLLALAMGWGGLQKGDVPFESSKMWRRLIPYAAALWAMNMLASTFSLSDRYMILHLMSSDESITHAAIGQYHSARIIPMLFVSLSFVVSSGLMPYLSADWEAGNTELVKDRLQRIAFAVATFFTAGAAITLMCAPWLFRTLLEDRYTEGLSLMPMTFVCCIWIAIGNITQDYLWVREKGSLVAIVIAIGFAFNILMNMMLIPVWGLHGAVVATLIANGIVLAGILVTLGRNGFGFDMTSWMVSLLPMSLMVSPTVALLTAGVVTVGSHQNRTWCQEGWSYLVDRVPLGGRFPGVSKPVASS